MAQKLPTKPKSKQLSQEIHTTFLYMDIPTFIQLSKGEIRAFIYSRVTYKDIFFEKRRVSETAAEISYRLPAEWLWTKKTMPPSAFQYHVIPEFTSAS